MKTLIITNPYITTAISNPIAAELTHGKPDNQYLRMITDKHEFDLYELKQELPDCIFILSELNWQTPEYCISGYDVASSILAKTPDGYIPNIQFLSGYKREKLYDRKFTSSMAKYFIKSFLHHHLVYSFHPVLTRYNSYKWAYLKKYALTKLGILDKLLHDLQYLLTDDSLNSTNNTEDIAERLLEIRSVSGDEICRHCKEYLEETPKNKENNLAFLNSLFIKAVKRLSDLRPKTIVAENTEPHKYKLLLLEDDEKMQAKLKTFFEPYYDVINFNDGAEAIDELRAGGASYNAMICDLELLEKNKIFDQPVQGIEVFDFAHQNYPHIAAKVITGLPRKGVSELLPNLSYGDILHKSLIYNLGMEELLTDFVNKLNRDIRKKSALLKMQGPESKFWRNYDNGSGFKLFYYETARDFPDEFNKMWEEIYRVVNDVKEDRQVHFIAGGFGRNQEFNAQKNIKFLKQLLTHRLILLSKYLNRATVVYKNDRDPANTYSKLPIWSSTLLVSPKTYCYLLGFGCTDLQPKTVTKDSSPVTFKLRYDELFEKEIEWLKLHPDLRSSRIEEFYERNEALCSLLHNTLTLIYRDQKQPNRRSQFKSSYPEPLDNVFEINEQLCLKILQCLASEPSLYSTPQLRSDIRDDLLSFQLNNLGETTHQYNLLTKEAQNLVDKAIAVL